MLANSHVMSRLVWTDSLDAFLWKPRRGAVFTPSRGYLEFRMELLVRINITDINITDINIMDINIMDFNIMDQLGS